MMTRFLGRRAEYLHAKPQQCQQDEEDEKSPGDWGKPGFAIIKSITANTLNLLLAGNVPQNQQYPAAENQQPAIVVASEHASRADLGSSAGWTYLAFS